MSFADMPMPGLFDDAPQVPQPKPEEPSEKTRRQFTKFFMFHDFDKEPLFNCPHGTEGGRNLVLCIDGTANQFSAQPLIQSSNIIEIYSRLIKLADEQLTFYNSGIGTYATPSFRSWKYFKQVFDHTVDTAIAWNFERIVHAAYKWLSETYQPGDRIFMFGFSRGAYQVRVVAGMIEKVGLLHKGSDNQIPFAYELYASVTSNSKRDRSANNKSIENFESAEDILCRQFKSTLCHEDVKVHFVGAWDTVSSIGLLRGQSLPETVSGMGHVCSFRHALALDEQRVKFQPEYANGGLGPRKGDTRGDVKEVWFAGTHSDVSGGNIANPELTNFSPSLRWMMQEAEKRGLRFKSTTKPWEPLPLTESLKWFWLPLEILPIRSLSYENEDGSTWWPHFCAGRRVQPGQRIHHTVFTRHQTSKGLYCPKASPPSGCRDWESLFEKCELSQDNPIFEFDPFENSAAFLSSLEEAVTTLSTTSSVSSEVVTQYSHSMLALRSYLEVHASRQISLNELPSIGKVLLAALDISLQPRNATTGINAHDLKEALVQLLAAVNLPRSRDGYGSKAYDIRRWVGRVAAKRMPDLAVVLNHFACVNHQTYNKYIWNLKFSHLDPTKIIFTSHPESTTYILIWDGSTEPPTEIAVVRGGYSTISLDGSHVAVGDGKDVNIINTAKQPPSVTKCTDNRDPNTRGIMIWSTCFSYNGHTLATGHLNGWIKLWQQEGEQWEVFKRFQGGDNMIHRLPFSRDGSLLVLKVPGTWLKLWNLADNVGIQLEDSLHSYSPAWSLSGDQIVSETDNGRVNIWSADRGKITHTFKAHDDAFSTRCLAVRDDGRVLATGSEDHRVRLWKWGTWEKIWEFDCGETVVSLAFSLDGKRLVSGGEKGALHLWDIDMGDNELVD
ncbi:hypothetical protein ONZ45_g15705 [Pleurotus djamor]|nr:hypothetical protein ONZ45_g15705 [Pleurotus djamor]